MTQRHAYGRASAFALALVVLTSTGTLARQDQSRTPLTQQIDRIMSTRTYATPRFGPARWVPGRAAYTTVEPAGSPGAGMDIVRYDAATGAREVIVPARLLTPTGAARGLAIDDYSWSPDGRRLLIFTNTRKVWRDNTRGDYWIVDLDPAKGTSAAAPADGAHLHKLGGAGPDASLLFAKFSPDSARVAYVRANDIYVERLDDGRITRLTSDGSETTINGTSDWVYEEELGVRDAFRWSPDSRAIAYWQFDSTGVEAFTLINSTDALYPTLTRIPYPKAGTRNSAVRIGVISADGGATTWLQVPVDPADVFIGIYPGVGLVAKQQPRRAGASVATQQVMPILQAIELPDGDRVLVDPRQAGDVVFTRIAGNLQPCGRAAVGTDDPDAHGTVARPRFGVRNARQRRV